jgi:hypothetical protein
MYDIMYFVYGVDFTGRAGKSYKIASELDLLEIHYSGDGDTPLYIGKSYHQIPAFTLKNLDIPWPPMKTLNKEWEAKRKKYLREINTALEGEGTTEQDRDDLRTLRTIVKQAVPKKIIVHGTS